MADNDQFNDEYQFAELDAMSPDAEGGQPAPSAQGNQATTVGKQAIKRKALFVVGLVFLLILVYQLVGSLFSGKKVTAKIPTVVSTSQQSSSLAPKSIVTTQPSSAIPQPQLNSTLTDTKTNQKLAILESTQQSMRSDVVAVNDQIGGIGKNMDAIVTKLTELNGVVAQLTTKVDEQSKELAQIRLQHRQVKRKHQPVHRAVARPPAYHLQAVIPGRAWLIATNGATLTVREGSIIAGYGMVRLIDPNQGRVTTSSGQVIRFSQEDS
jgi:intracellular multiplication protein IcmG